MSETLSGLRIRSRRRLCGARRGGFLPLTTCCKFMAHCEFISICIFLGKWRAELREDKSFANHRLLENTIFTACQKGDQFVFRAAMCLKKYLEPFQKLAATRRTSTCFINRGERHKKSPWNSLLRSLWNPPHFKWRSPSSTDYMLFPARCDHQPLLFQSHGQSTKENVLQSFVSEWLLRHTAFCFVVAGSLCLEVVIICPR